MIKGMQWKNLSDPRYDKGIKKFVYLLKGKNINLIQGMTVRRLRSTPGMKAMPGGLTGITVVANINIIKLLTDTRSSTSTGPAPREWRM